MVKQFESLAKTRARVDKANAWMEEILAEYELTDAELKWWNASVDQTVTADEMNEIVMLYESVAGEVFNESLEPVIMQHIYKYWEGFYGQKKTDQLLLAVYRAG